MSEVTPSGATSDRARRSHSGAPRPAASAQGLLDIRRTFKRTTPDSSVGSVRKVAKLDARTHIIAAREPGGKWFRLVRRTRFTRENARVLREAGISEVVLRRGLHSASFPLGWLSQKPDR